MVTCRSFQNFKSLIALFAENDKKALLSWSTADDKEALASGRLIYSSFCFKLVLRTVRDLLKTGPLPYDRVTMIIRKGAVYMDEVRLKDELMARLSNELDRPALQVIDGALSAVLRNYEVAKRETGLSTNVLCFPELDIFLGKMRFENYSTSTVNQYQRFLTDLLVFVGKPIQEITGEDVVECLNYYEQARQISTSTKDHKRRIASSFFTFLHERGYIQKNPMATVDPIKYVAEIREALTPREMEKMRIACGANIRDNTVLELFLATGCRVSEVVGMKVEDIDLAVGCVKVLGKGQKGDWAELLKYMDLEAINPTDKILQTSNTKYPRVTVFTDSQGGLFVRCYTSGNNYVELAVTSVGAYANKCVNGTVSSTTKFATFN